jgi:hypothetical protein
VRYIGGVVIKRSIWLARERERYYGSMFIHVGVIFQAPLPGETLVTQEPLISFRGGNVHTFTSRAFELMMFGWPSLVWSLALTDAAKKRVCSTEPWRQFWPLLRHRAEGIYSSIEYQRLIRPRLRCRRQALAPKLVTLLPGFLVNALFLLYYSVAGRYRRLHRFMLRESRFYFWNLQIFRSER